MIKKRRIYRRVALEQLSSPEQLNQLMQVTGPMGWVALLALSLLLLTAILWGVFGSLPVTVAGQGVLVGGGINDVASPVPGQIKTISVREGEMVKAGQIVARVVEEGQAASTKIRSPYDGKVLEIKANESNLVERGTPILSIEEIEEATVGGQSLEAVIYAPPAEGKKVESGMAVHIAPSTVPREKYGLLRGTVRTVGQYPATAQGMFRTLGNADLVKALSAEGAPIEIRAQLIPDNETSAHCNYMWTSSTCPDFEIDSGTLIDASVIIDEQCPLSLVLPGFEGICPR
jgi:hypothetical protein